MKDNVGCANNDAQDVSSEKETNKQKLTQTQAQKDNVVRKKKPIHMDTVLDVSTLSDEQFVQGQCLTWTKPHWDIQGTSLILYTLDNAHVTLHVPVHTFILLPTDFF